MATVYFRGTRADITRIALQLAAVLAGRASDTHGVARGFMLTLGFAALTDIKEAYLIKATGGTDEMGIRWPPLSPETIANRRIGRGDKTARKRKGETFLQRLSRIESANLIKLREKIRKRETKKALKRFRLSLPEPEAQRRAKIVGGLKATRETGATKVVTLGSRSVEILRDTGVLLNSLSPGRLTGSGGSVGYTPPGGEGGSEQIFQIGAGEVIVGSNVKYFRTHQRGDSGVDKRGRKRNIPQRKVLPDAETPVPRVWWDRWTALANKGLVVGAELLYRRGV